MFKWQPFLTPNWRLKKVMLTQALKIFLKQCFLLKKKNNFNASTKKYFRSSHKDVEGKTVSFPSQVSSSWFLSPRTSTERIFWYKLQRQSFQVQMCACVFVGLQFFQMQLCVCVWVLPSQSLAPYTRCSAYSFFAHLTLEIISPDIKLPHFLNAAILQHTFLYEKIWVNLWN